MSKHESHENHVTGYGIYLLVWLGLLMLTGITVAVAGIDFGRISITVALLIAAIKSWLVLTIFMHLKFEDTTFKIFVFVAVITFVILIVLLFFDYLFM
jgi:cytochrome c oxidase subunit IV